MRGGGEDRFEKKGEAYHARVRDAFLEIAARDTRHYRVIDGGRSMDRVSDDIIAQVNQHFGLALEAVRDID